MKQAILFVALFSSSAVHAESLFYVNNTNVSKLEAVRHAMKGESVMRCQQVELTEKLTFKGLKTATKLPKSISKKDL